MVKIDETCKIPKVGTIQPSSAERRDDPNASDLPFTKRVASFCVSAIGALMLALVVWISLITVFREGQNSEQVKILLQIFLFAAALVAIFLSKPVIAKVLNRLSPRRALLSVGFILIALGLVARIVFSVFDYLPTSDPESFFSNATSLLQTRMLSNPAYIAEFPFLFAYNALLAGMFKLTGSGLHGIIILNSAFDALAALGVGQLIFLLSASHKWRVVGSVFWWISPFNIIFCAISLPVIVVNALIIIGLVLIVYLFKNIGDLKRTFFLSVLVSFVLAAEDAFRPITIITVIGILIYYVIYLLKHHQHKLLRNCILSFLIIAILNAVLGHGWQQVVNSATGLPANTNKQGWSIYVGSNYKSSGGWNREDSDHEASVLKEFDGDYSRAFDILQREGIYRWKQLGPIKAMVLMVRKFIRLTGNNQNMIYNLQGSFPYFKEHGLQFKLMVVMCAVYWFIMLAFTVCLFLARRRVKKLDFIGFLSIITIGLILAFMAVEVASRYFTVFFPAFTVFAVMGLKRTLEAFMGRFVPAHQVSCECDIRP